MRIITGVVSLDEAKRLINLTDEIYFGVEEIKNYRYFLNNYNISSFNDSCKLIELVHSQNKKVNLAINEIYERKYYDDIFKKLKKYLDAEIDGIILRDPAFISFLNKKKVKQKLILSSLSTCFNKASFDFFVNIGIKRVILPQHLLPLEAKELIKNKSGIETEVFYTPLCFCKNLDGLCPLHFDKAKIRICNQNYKNGNSIYSLKAPPKSKMLTMLYEYYHLGVNSLKVSRDGWNRGLLLMQIKKMIKDLNSGISLDNFIKEYEKGIF